MQLLLGVSRRIDRVASAIGRTVAWLVIVAAAISAGNAVIRKLFDLSSNAWLELQWWLFGAVFLLAAPWTLLANEHIRIDIINSRFSKPRRDWIEVVGHVFFLLPMCAVLVGYSWPFFLSSAPSRAELFAHASQFDIASLPGWLASFFALGEQSSNAGGLPLWPVKALLPVAFALLFVQGLSELIKRVAIMRGELGDPPEGESYHKAALEMPERREG